MKENISKNGKEDLERVYLVGLDTGEDQNFALSMEELGSLAEACEMEVIGQATQSLADVNKAFYIGTGKVQEVKELAEQAEAECVIFDGSLTPSQLSNLRDEIGIPVMDRTTLILEIFATRAKSRESKLQVEVARLQYLLPRLVGLGAALSRQGGGTGSRSNKGAGEKKLELDRRYLEHRLNEMKQELKEVVKQRQTQRKQRSEAGIPRVALVGYTNAGKSTLMNAMLHAYRNNEEDKQVLVKDMLFATLDTTVRKIAPPNRTPILLSDTVGFVNKLPHNLVEAFKSTLEEAVEADLILEVVDASDEHYKEQIQVTDQTLTELGAGAVPKLYLYNKADRILDPATLPVLKEDRIYLSAREEIGLTELYDCIENALKANYRECMMKIPYARGDVLADLTAKGAVRGQKYVEDGIELTLFCALRDYNKYEEFRCDQS